MPTVYNKVVADNTTLIDLSQDTVTQASHIVTGYVGHLADGTQVTGTGGGGGPTPVPEKDVNFIDYDGTVLYSYTAQEAAALADLPANPSHTGLTAQGWNYTLAQMKAEVTAQGKCTVGQMYTTSDGKTRIYITIPESASGDMLGFTVRYTQTESNGVQVDWGDGSAAETFTGTSATNHDHTYSQPGDYTISLKVLNGKVSFVGSSSYSIFGSTGTGAGRNRSRIRKVEIGSDVTEIGAYAFYYCYLLETVSVSTSVTGIGNNAFYYCYALKSLTIPSNVTSVGTNTFSNCFALNTVSIRYGLTSLSQYEFAYCDKLESLVIPSSVTSISAYALQNCYALKAAVIPSGVTSIGATAFSNDYSIGEIRFCPTTAPTVGGSNAWTNVPSACRIYIPFSALAGYLGASNYPSKTSYTYVGYATYASGATLPSKDSTNAYNVTWYASKADAIAQTNAISQGTGGEIYCRYTAA